MDNGLLNSNSFTCKYKGRTYQLITECKVCKAFNPSAHTGNYPELVTFNALWDTGATGTVITKKVAEALGILPTGQSLVHHANGSDIVNTYIVNIMLPNNVGIPEVDVTEGDLTGFDILIGMNIIQYGDFSVSCKNGNTVFSFQLPSTRELDFVSEHKKEVAKVKISNRQSNPPLDKRIQARRKRKKR
jgi:predicted aspartyl protease